MVDNFCLEDEVRASRCAAIHFLIIAIIGLWFHWIVHGLSALTYVRVLPLSLTLRFQYYYDRSTLVFASEGNKPAIWQSSI